MSGSAISIAQAFSPIEDEDRVLSVRQAASRYLACRGWYAVAIERRSKKAYEVKWQTLRLEERDLDERFPPGTKRNLGTLLGAASGGLLDVDLDCPEAIRAASVLLPPTDLVFGRASAPRSHLLYHSTDVAKSWSFEDPMRAGQKDAMLVEFRVTGQTVFPPSIHKETGERIAWDSPHASRYKPIAGLALKDHVREIAAVALLARYWPKEGSRHDAVNALAGWLARCWHEERAQRFMETLMETVGHRRNDYLQAVKDAKRNLDNGHPVTGAPKLIEVLQEPGERVVPTVAEWLGLHGEHTHNESAGIEQQEEWDTPIPLDEYETPELRPELVPSFCREFVVAESRFNQVPLEVPFLLVLGVVSAAIQKKAHIEVFPGYREQLSLFAAVVAPPASRKTQVFNSVTRPVTEYEQELQREATVQRLEPLRQKAILEARLQVLTKKAGNSDEQTERDAVFREAAKLDAELLALHVPAMPQLITADATPEAIVRLLAEQNGRIACFSSEAPLFEIVTGRYSAKGQPNLEAILSGHSGDNIRVNRANGNYYDIRSPAIAMALTIQPAVITGHSSERSLSGRGFWARFLFAVPKDRIGTRKVENPPVPAPLRTRYHALVRGLLEIPIVLDDHGCVFPRTIDLSVEAKRVWIDFAERIEPELATFGALGGTIQGWGGKLAGAVARIAGLIHFAENAHHEKPWHLEVTPDTMRVATRLGEFFIPHALAAYSLLRVDPSVVRALRLLEWRDRSEIQTFTRRDAHRAIQSQVESAKDVDSAILALIDHGYVRQLDSAIGRQGGRPSGKFIFRPPEKRDKTDKTAQSPQAAEVLSSRENGENGEKNRQIITTKGDEVLSLLSSISGDLKTKPKTPGSTGVAIPRKASAASETTEEPMPQNAPSPRKKKPYKKPTITPLRVPPGTRTDGSGPLCHECGGIAPAWHFFPKEPTRECALHGPGAIPRTTSEDTASNGKRNTTTLSVPPPASRAGASRGYSLVRNGVGRFRELGYDLTLTTDKRDYALEKARAVALPLEANAVEFNEQHHDRILLVLRCDDVREKLGRKSFNPCLVFLPDEDEISETEFVARARQVFGQSEKQARGLGDWGAEEGILERKGSRYRLSPRGAKNMAGCQT